MENFADPAETERDVTVAIYAGATVTAILTLLPYVSALVIPAYIAGAVATIWHRLVRQKVFLLPGDAAKLGLYSTFIGGIAAVIVFDTVWQVWDYQVGERQNAQFLLALMGTVANEEFLDLAAQSLEQSARSPFSPYVIAFQLLSTAFLAATFGSLSGVVACRVLRGSSSPNPLRSSH